MQLHQGQLLRSVAGSCTALEQRVAQGGMQGASSRTPCMQQEQPHEPLQQQQQRGRAAATAAAGSSSNSTSKVFTVTTLDVKTVPVLLQLFETGWPVTSPDKIYTGLVEAGFARGLPSKQAQQHDLLRQGYLLVKAVAQQYEITTQTAAAVVEIWRDNVDAVIGADGSVEAAEAGVVTAGRTVPSMLPPKSKQWTMNNLCQTARGFDCVKAQKNSVKSAAGKQGGSAPKKQRKE